MEFERLVVFLSSFTVCLVLLSKACAPLMLLEAE